MDILMIPYYKCEVLIIRRYQIHQLDLPNLTSITSVGDSFAYPNTVILESISNIVQNVNLPDSFKNVIISEINSNN